MKIAIIKDKWSKSDLKKIPPLAESGEEMTLEDAQARFNTFLYGECGLGTKDIETGTGAIIPCPEVKDLFAKLQEQGASHEQQRVLIRDLYFALLIEFPRIDFRSGKRNIALVVIKALSQAISDTKDSGELPRIILNSS